MHVTHYQYLLHAGSVVKVDLIPNHFCSNAPIEINLTEVSRMLASNGNETIRSKRAAPIDDDDAM